MKKSNLKNYVQTTLGELCVLDNGVKVHGGKLPLLDVKYLRGKKEAEYLDSGVVLNDGQYAILVDGENSGEVFRIHETGYMGSTFKRLACPDDRLLEYLLYIIKFNQKMFRENKKGSAIPHLDKKLFKELLINLPPLAEQGRIVAKIEELFAGIDAGVENLKAVKNQIALYRQSVLKSAFDFDASTFSALKNLIDKVRYGTSKKCSTEENVNSMLVYRIPNIDFKKGVLDKTDLKFASFDDSEKSSLMLKSGDILIIRSNGSLNLVGRAALVYNTDTNGLYAGYLMRLRIKDTEKLLPKFLLHFLNSGKARAYIEEKAKSTSGVNNINSEEISDLQIPVPTLAEQERIVAEIESRFERADALETAVDRALNDAEKLKQAVLKKAFSGELVPQNPDDEPASVLLARIRAARASELPAKKGKRK